MAFHVYPTDALYASQTAAPVGAPSLSDSEIINLYNYWLNRPPDPVELASERDNAMKYSAAGIERQIANRSGNVAGSGVRGDEGSVSLSIAAPSPVYVSHADAGNYAATGAAAGAASLAIAPAGPTGLVAPWRDLPQFGSSSSAYGSPFDQPAGGGLSLMTLAIGAAVIGAGWFLWQSKGR
jgi:hypothetical protein